MRKPRTGSGFMGLRPFGWVRGSSAYFGSRWLLPGYPLESPFSRPPLPVVWKQVPHSFPDRSGIQALTRFRSRSPTLKNGTRLAGTLMIVPVFGFRENLPGAARLDIQLREFPLLSTLL